MCGPSSPPLCLLLWIVGATVSGTRGEVIAPAWLSEEAGRPLRLSCEVATATGVFVRKVRWFDGHGKVLLAYEHGIPVNVSHQDPRVQLTTSHDNGSSITIKKVQPGDEGCYRCVFYTFPAGQQEGKTCVRVAVHVRPEGDKTAVSGQPAALSCSYSIPDRVNKVLWRKSAEQGNTATTVASYARSDPQIGVEQATGRVTMSRSFGETQLTIRPVRVEDEACYTCEFQTHQGGNTSAVACLSVYVLPKPVVSHVTSSSGVTEANCTTKSRPAARISWDVAGDNRTLGPPIYSAYEDGDGTTTATSTLLFQSSLLSDVAVRCVVHHQGLRNPLTVCLNTNVGVDTAIVLLMCGVAVALPLCLCVCLCRCFVCT